jgi:hypothetical protein
VTHVIALFDYVPVDEEELPLKKGQRVAVLATDENRKGWIYAQGAPPLPALIVRPKAHAT